MISRRQMLAGIPALAAGSAAANSYAAGDSGDLIVGDDGLHKQPWFLDSFMELADDLEMAADSEKNFAVLIEQRGCPYCRELHAVNFKHDEISAYIQANFDVLQLDMWGSREVVDFNGDAQEERKLIQSWQINFTPTMVFFPRDPSLVVGKAGREAEVARMPGYFKPFHFLSMLEYVREEIYVDQPFQRYLQDKFARLEAEGKDAEVW